MESVDLNRLSDALGESSEAQGENLTSTITAADAVVENENIAYVWALVFNTMFEANKRMRNQNGLSSSDIKHACIHLRWLLAHKTEPAIVRRKIG